MNRSAGPSPDPHGDMVAEPFFEGFDLFHADAGEARLRVRHGGKGPPVLLLHGHPRTHTTWHRVAPRLAGHLRVVCPDLRGFGLSSQPADTPDHRGSSKRAKGEDCVRLMQQLGFDRFSLVGHDRGAYTAFRCAMDHPDRIEKLIIIDAVPIIEALDRINEQFAMRWWHWFFFGVPEKPERAINSDPERWYEHDRAAMGPRNHDDFLQAIRNPQVVHGMLEDYRAGLAIDRAHDQADRARGRKLDCPTLFLWSSKDDMAELYSDPLAIWKNWARDVRGQAIESGHHVAEENPEALSEAILTFITGRDPEQRA